MRIPENTLFNSRISAYGVRDLESADIELAYGGGCPAVYRAKYESHTLVEPSSYAMDYGSVIHDALYAAEEEGLPLLPDALDKAWSQSEMPLGPAAYQEAVDDLTAYMERGGANLSMIAVEQDLRMPLMEYQGEQWFYGGMIDYLAIDATEEEVTTIFMGDYKTDRQPPSKDKVAKLPQLTGYAALVRANMEKFLPGQDPREIQIVTVYDAIKWYPLFSPRQHWELDSWEDWARAIARKIIDDVEGNPVLNEGCSSCPLKYDCSEFKKLPGKGETLIDRMSTTTDLTQRVYLMQQAELVLKGLKGAVDDVRRELANEAHGLEDGIVFNGVRYSVSDSMESEWDSPQLHKLLGPSFYDVINVVNGRVDEKVKRDIALKEAVEGCKQKVGKGTRLSTKKA